MTHNDQKTYSYRTLGSYAVFFVLLLYPFSLKAQEFIRNAAGQEISAIKDPKEVINTQLATLETLIALSKRTLAKTEDLREQIEAYKSIQERFFENTQDKELLYNMMKSAHFILKSIKADHLTHLFDPEFLDELQMMSQIFNKIGLPKPYNKGMELP